MVVCCVGWRTTWIGGMDVKWAHDGLTPIFCKIRGIIKFFGPYVIKVAAAICCVYPVVRIVIMHMVTKPDLFAIKWWAANDVAFMFLYFCCLLWFGIPQGMACTSTMAWAYLVPVLNDGPIAKKVQVYSQRHLESFAMCDEFLMDKSGFLGEELLKVEMVSIQGYKDPVSADTVRPHHFGDMVLELLQIGFFYLLHVKLLSQADEETQRLFNKLHGPPISIALTKWLKKLLPFIDLEQSAAKYKINIIRQYAGNIEETRRHGCLVRYGQAYRYFCIGASEYVLPLCTKQVVFNGNLSSVQECNDIHLCKTRDIIASMTDKGLKPIILAYKDIPKPTPFMVPDTNFLADAPPEKHMTILCVFGIRQKHNIMANEVVSYFNEIGMNLRLVCNDHPDVGEYVARKTGILEDQGKVTVSYDMAELGAADQYELYQTTKVFARMSHHDRYRLVRKLQDMDFVVASTGYRPLDVPAMMQVS